MYDRSIPMITLSMRADSMENLPVFDLPASYGWRYFQPGDERAWAEIETASGEFLHLEDAQKSFRREFPTDDHLGERMIFLTYEGKPFATVTAWFQPDGEGRLHWVSMDPQHQGKGLSKCMISLAMHRMRELGHKSAYLVTHTASWVAIKVYYGHGFRPVICNAQEIEGWKIVSEKSGIDFMQYIH